MFKRCVVGTLVFVMAYSTVGFSQVARTMTSGVIGQSHDGNAWDNDDQYATAMDFAIIAAFGYQKHYVFLEHSVVGPGCNNAAWHTIMQESARAPLHFPGFLSGFIFDAWVDGPAVATTYFVKVANKLSATCPLYFCLSGPMELPWRHLNAVSAAQRAFITCVSHSTANDGMGTCPPDGGAHHWTDIGALVKTVHISDQNSNLGGGTNWSWLATLANTATFPAGAGTWLSGQNKKNGDCSDAGMVWYVLTNMQNGRPADAQARFNNPLPMDAFDFWGTSIGPAAGAAGLSNNHVAVTFSQVNRVLKVMVNGMGDGSIVIHNILGQAVCKAPMVSGQAQLALGTTTSGNYFVAIESKGQKVLKEILLK